MVYSEIHPGDGAGSHSIAMANFYDGKKVAVTGGSGLVGSYVVKALAESGAKVRAIVHRRPPNEYTKMATEIVKKDLMSQDDAREAVAGAEIVFGAGGITGGIPLALNDPGALVAPNAVINSQVIHACAKARVERLGFVSSTVVYPALERPVREEDSLIGEPYHLYSGIGWVKRFSERLCKYYSDAYGMKVAIVRPSGVYGRYDNFDESTSHVLPAFIKRAVSNPSGSFVVWGDGMDVRDFLHSSDLARALLLAVEKYAVCDAVNIASGQAVTTKELAQTVLRVTGSTAKLVFDPSKPTALKNRMVDISKAKRVLGFEPRVSLQSGLQDTVEWYRNQ